MRLVCPNCDAQYEVPDDVLPAAGRDVQCSDCGKTWFQQHPDDIEEESPPEIIEVAKPPAPLPVVEPKRKQLDPAVSDILRQEAETENAARRASQASNLESQPDLGLSVADAPVDQEADRRARRTSERMERLGTAATTASETQATVEPDLSAPVAAGAGALGSRRDLLPDIEEINSTLRSGSSRNGSSGAMTDPEIEAPTHQRKRRSFRAGFITVFLVFVVLGALYVLAPRLGEAVPSADGPLKAYVAMVDEGRAWLDIKVQSMLKYLDSAAAGSSS